MALHREVEKKNSSQVSKAHLALASCFQRKAIKAGNVFVNNLPDLLLQLSILGVLPPGQGGFLQVSFHQRGDCSEPESDDVLLLITSSPKTGQTHCPATDQSASESSPQRRQHFLPIV